jgi:hypothetical protein
MSRSAYAVLPPSPDIPELARLFVPAFTAAALYGVAHFERSGRPLLAVVTAATVVFVAFRRVSAGRISVWDMFRIEEMDLEIATLVRRVLVSGAILTVAALVGAVLRGLGRKLRVAPDLVAFLACGAWLFFPRPCPMVVPASRITKVFSPEVHGKDLYFWAYVDSPPSFYGGTNPVSYLLRTREGSASADCLWPCSAGFPGKASPDAARFAVAEHRWWYLLFSSQVALKILDTGTGWTETYFRDRLGGYREQPGKYGWPGNVRVGAKGSWAVISNDRIAGRLESGRRFGVAEVSRSQASWFQHGKLNVLLWRSGTRLSLTSIDMKTGEVARTSLPRADISFSPRRNRLLIAERGQKDGRSLRRLFALDDENRLVLVDNWRYPGDEGLVVWPGSGRPSFVPPIPGPGPSYRDYRLYSCSEVGGHCLAIEEVGSNPTPDRFPVLHELDLATGAYRSVAAFAGSIQWLDDSVVLAEVDLRNDSGFSRARQRIVRFFPRDGRTDTLFSLPNDIQLR